ncbi:MAG: hypothetical protein ACXAB2_04695, partial [Candidatus Hodarchaeales archaeon]
DTGSVIPETAELKSEEHASPQVESESELLKVIGELKSETKSPLDDVSPTTPPTRVFEAPDEEITQIEPESVKFGQPEEVLEIPVREDAGKQATTLSDQEVANLFASSDSELEKTVSTPTKIDEDLIGEFATKPESGVTLSDDEIDGLFSKRKEAETEAKKWEVDSFGRLMKKEEKIPTPAVSQKIDYPEVSEEISGTPDLSSLEKTYEKPEEDVFKPTQLKSLQVEIEDSDLTYQILNL